MAPEPIVSEVSRQAFDQAFLRSPEANRVVLPDGRPGILIDSILEFPQIVTMHHKVWDMRKSEFATKHQAVGSREMSCATCGCKMRVTREFEETWSFKCDQCGSVDTWAKHKIGGTMGGGETEKV